MAQRKKLLEDLEAINTIKNLAESYEEVAVVKMQKLKDSVLKTRDFLSELSDVYVDLKSSYEREVKDLIERRTKGDKSVLPVLQKNGKTLIVYLSSNGKLYGSVTQKTYNLFIKDVKNPEYQQSDIFIIGSSGKELYEASGYGKKFEYFEIPDTTVNTQHVIKLMKKFLPYDKVHIYYGKFDNVITQSPISTSISGDDIFEIPIEHPTSREDRFIFEPDLQKIFHFFETQIMANLFSQTLIENQLARHASRVNAMEEALIHIGEESKRIAKLQNTLKHQQQNKKQLETISGVISLGE